MTKTAIAFGIPVAYTVLGPPAGALIIMLYGTINKLLVFSSPLDFSRLAKDTLMLMAVSYFFGGISALLSGIYLGWQVSHHSVVSLPLYFGLAAAPPSIVLIYYQNVFGPAEAALWTLALAVITATLFLLFTRKFLATTPYAFQLTSKMGL